MSVYIVWLKVSLRGKRTWVNLTWSEGLNRLTFSIFHFLYMHLLRPELYPYLKFFFKRHYISYPKERSFPICFSTNSESLGRKSYAEANYSQINLLNIPQKHFFSISQCQNTLPFMFAFIFSIYAFLRS